MGKIIALLSTVCLLSSCATLTENKSSAQVEVHKGAPVVYIYPLEIEAYSQASVGVLPFSMPANMSDEMGVGIAALFKDVLLGKQTFSKIKLLDQYYGDYEEAVAIGRKHGTDMVLAGKVNYLIEGTELGGSRIDISVRLLNSSTGATVWHINQAMDQPMDYPKSDPISLIISSLVPPPTKKPAGAPVVTNMLAQAAVDMADVIIGAKYVRR